MTLAELSQQFKVNLVLKLIKKTIKKTQKNLLVISTKYNLDKNYLTVTQ